MAGRNVDNADFDIGGTGDGMDGIKTFTSRHQEFVIEHRAREDQSAEGNESYTITLYSDAARTNQVGNIVTITIQDTLEPSKHFGNQITSITGCDDKYPYDPRLQEQCEDCNKGAPCMKIPSWTLPQLAPAGLAITVTVAIFFFRVE